MQKIEFLVFLLLMTLSQVALCQIQSYEAQVRSEMHRRGIDEGALRLALSNKGIDLDNLENLNPAQIEEIRSVLEQLEAENPEPEVSIFNDQVEVILPDSLEEDVQEVIADLDESTKDSLITAIYGHQFFINGQIAIIEDEDSFIPQEDYIIGIGDELSASIYGVSRVEDTYRVDGRGTVNIYPTTNNPGGNVRVNIGGLSLSKAREKLLQTYKKYYRFSPTQFTLTVSAVRKVRVQVAGEVLKPGEFVVSGLNGVQNLIAAAGGLTHIGSVRKISINKRDGRNLNFDFYKLLTNPDYIDSFALDNGDVIFVPAAQNLVSIDGAIRRAHTYELLEGEGVISLIQYAGGLDRGALLTAFEMQRFEEDKLTFKEIPYAQLIKNRQDYALQNGDEITVERVEEVLENYVTLRGEVRNAGNFELLDNMTIKDLLLLGILKANARTDEAYIRRTSTNGNVTMIPFSVHDVMSGTNGAVNMTLQDRDEITVWALERFEDNREVKISGAVRYPSTFQFDEGGSLRVKDIITLAGGLSNNAAHYAHIHRIDPLNPSEMKYVRIDLERVSNDPAAADNLYLEPFDSIHVYQADEFLEDLSISISGAVKNPGNFTFGEGMTLQDALVLAGGFKLSSATNHIEISRVVIRNNEPTRTIVEKVSLTRDELREFNLENSTFELEPFDNVFVRYVPQFELQQNVTILGEVSLPGTYSLIKDNESVYDLIVRAGGLTPEAFTPAATLERAEDNLGNLVMRLDEVMQDPNSKSNYVLKNQDVIFIPKVKDYVRIVGYAQYLIQNDEPQVVSPYHEGERAEFYIDEYAGGFADNARKDKIFVKYPNGEVKTTKKKLFGRKHPEVLPGSTIQIGPKKVDPTPKGENDDVNWTKVLGDSVAQAMSILTLILLVQRLD